MQLNVTDIHILKKKYGMDLIVLHTDLPDACWPYTGTADFLLHSAKDKAEEYVKKHFPGVPIKITEDV